LRYCADPPERFDGFIEAYCIEGVCIPAVGIREFCSGVPDGWWEHGSRRLGRDPRFGFG